ncbi:DgyrCDS13695 [Dimorphilus gyrociliatus]|uniref:DgyrCDS13695 n=1 Tax=Dimorphilus gyrociliatus TaxID=2664684 RepID=A0A7I8WBG3_9ANNE|nr:DgyrCDS13695 [Dimorphilus gyrociliatus]
MEVANDNIYIKWKKSISPTSKPLSYVVFSRYVISPLHKPIHKDDYSDWMTAPSSITHSQQISFPAKPGRFYKFYVKAVSEDGASEASYAKEGQAVRLIREPSSPGSVKDLEMVGKLTEDGKNTIVLKWKEPIDSDLPIDSYKIKYQKMKKRRKNRQRDWMMDDAGLKSPTSERRRRKRRHEARVSHNEDKEQKYTLKNLSAGSFEISVSAIAKYGHSSLESKPNTIVVDLPQTSLGSFRHKDRRNNLPKVTGLTHSRPLYDKKDGLIFNITWEAPKTRRKLKAYKVKWTFKGCLKTATTKISGHVLRKKNYHVFKNLPFQCNINVEVSYETKSKKSTFYSLPANYEFSTGSCMDVKMVYLLKDSPDACSDNNSSKTEKAVPEDLRISNVVKLRNRKQKTIILKIQWKPPSNKNLNPYKYRVSWNPVSKNDEEEKSSAEYRVVKAKNGLNTVTIENSVRQKTNYRVSVESIFKLDGRLVFSRPVVRQQKTPNLGFGSSAEEEEEEEEMEEEKKEKEKEENQSFNKQL